MLLNWFVSSTSDSSNLKNKLNSQDLRLLGIQYCTHLLAAGVLRQITDKNAPTEVTFKPNLMYYWAHMELPTSQPVTPGKLDLSSWPPDKISNNIKKDVSKNEQIQKINDIDIPNIPEAQNIIYNLMEKVHELKCELEFYKSNSHLNMLNDNLKISANLSKESNQLCDKEVQTLPSEDDKGISSKSVIHFPKENTIRNSILCTNNKLGFSNIDSENDFLHKSMESQSELRSDKIENYCKLNKSREKSLHKNEILDNVENNENQFKQIEVSSLNTQESSSDASFLSTTADMINCDLYIDIRNQGLLKDNLTDKPLSSEKYTEEKPKTNFDSLQPSVIDIGNNSILEHSDISSDIRKKNVSVANCMSPVTTSLPKILRETQTEISVKTPYTSKLQNETSDSEIFNNSNELLSGKAPMVKEDVVSGDGTSIPLVPVLPSTDLTRSPIASTQEHASQQLVTPKSITPTSSPVIPDVGQPPPPPLPGVEPSPPPMPGTISPITSDKLKILSPEAASEKSSQMPQPSSPVPVCSPPTLTKDITTNPPSMTTVSVPPLMSFLGPPPPPMPDIGSALPTIQSMGPPPPPLPCMGPPPPPLPGMGPPPPPMPSIGPPLPPMPVMGPPPPPMPGMGPPPPPMPGVCPPPPPPIPGMGPPPPPMPGIMPPPPPIPGSVPPPPGSCIPPAPPGTGPPPPPVPGAVLASSASSTAVSAQTGPVPFPAPPIGGWNVQRATLRKTPIKPAAPMKPLYWTRILAAPVAPVYNGEGENHGQKPLWLELEEAKLDNIDEFADLFSRQVVKAPVKKKVEVKTKIQPIKILDSKRSQNVGILAQSLHVEFSEIENAIYNFDTSVVSLEALQQIYELRATEEELQLIKDHLKNKPDIPLDKPEAFLHDLSGIQNFAERISCFTFQAEFEDAANTIMHKLDNLKHTCEFLTTSESLKQLFAIILTLGNYMNGGNGQRGQADGFGLEILSKLKDVKSKQSAVTLLHFIVRSYCRARGGPLTAPLPVPEPGDVSRAAALDFADAAAQLRTLRTQLDECENKMKKVIECEESQRVIEENAGGENTKSLDVFKDKMTTFIKSAEEKLALENENLNDCRNKFLATVKFYQYTPRCGKPEDCEPKEFFSLWISFCSDFKDIFKKEEQIAIKEKLKETKKMQEERKAHTQPKKEGGLKARLQKLASTRK